jgi:hypothetical protein
VISGAVFEAPAFVAGFDDVAVMGQARVCGRWAYFGLIRDLVVLKSLRLFGWQSGFQAQKCGHTN